MWNGIGHIGRKEEEGSEGREVVPGLEGGDDAGLGDGDGLLLHGLVDGRAVLVVHLVKLVDQAHALCVTECHTREGYEGLQT